MSFLKVRLYYHQIMRIRTTHLLRVMHFSKLFLNFSESTSMGEITKADMNLK